MRYVGYALGFLGVLFSVSFADPVTLAPAMVPGVMWQARSGTVYVVEWTLDLSMPWQVAEYVCSDADGPRWWSEVTDTFHCFYRAREMDCQLEIPFVETFEDDNGWSDHPEGDWEHLGCTGSWTGTSCRAVTSIDLAYSGTRCIKFNAAWDRLTLPVGPGVTNIAVWIRGTQNTPYEQAMIRLIGFDGDSWYQVGNVAGVYTTSWERISWTIDTPSVWQGYTLETINAYLPIYIDNVTINGYLTSKATSPPPPKPQPIKQ